MNPSLLADYLSGDDDPRSNPAAVAYYAALDNVASVSPPVAQAIVHELRDQRSNVKFIASENYASLATQLALGNLLTDKYAEGYSGHRFYSGCDNVDVIEDQATSAARELFNADHAYVQPHSGADANLVAFLAVLSVKAQQPFMEEMGEKDPSKMRHDQWEKVRQAFLGQTMLAMDYYAGGHLTHGYRHNVSSMLFDARSYGVDSETGLLDLDEVRKIALECRPLLIVAGYSAYPRKINFAKFREIADEVGAVLMVDMAHFAGLVAGQVFEGDFNPVPHAHIVTSTTHKTLRGPRGGIVLCQKEFAEWIDKGCPIVLGGPLPHCMAAKAIALREAARVEFRDYAAKIVENAQAFAEALISEDIRVATNGTDNHIILVDVQTSFGITGRQAEAALRECGLTLNRNSLPGDPNGPWYTSGLRFGTPATTTLGMGPDEMREFAKIVRSVLASVKQKEITKGSKAGQISKAKYSLDATAAEDARQRVSKILQQYPIYPELDLDRMLNWCSGIGE